MACRSWVTSETKMHAADASPKATAQEILKALGPIFTPTLGLEPEDIVS